MKDHSRCLPRLGFESPLTVSGAGRKNGMAAFQCKTSMFLMLGWDVFDGLRTEQRDSSSSLRIVASVSDSLHKKKPRYLRQVFGGLRRRSPQVQPNLFKLAVLAARQDLGSQTTFRSAVGFVKFSSWGTLDSRCPWWTWHQPEVSKNLIPLEAWFCILTRASITEHLLVSTYTIVTESRPRDSLQLW